MRTIRNTRAVITGAANGIGREISLALAREGAHLYLLDNDEVGLAATVRDARDSGIDAIGRYCDLSDARQIDQAVDAILQECGTPDILVNNAGVAYYGPTRSMSDGQWDNLLNVNILAPVRLTRRFLAGMEQKTQAHIVNVCSMYGFAVTNRSAAYHLSKFALLGFSEALRAEYNRVGLGVTALCPGFVATQLHQEAEQVEGRTERQVPAWACTTAERVASKAVSAIYQNRRVALVGWSAHLLYHLRRIAPGAIDRIYGFGRRKWLRVKSTQATVTPLALHDSESTEWSDDTQTAAPETKHNHRRPQRAA